MAGMTYGMTGLEVIKTCTVDFNYHDLNSSAVAFCYKTKLYQTDTDGSTIRLPGVMSHKL